MACSSEVGSISGCLPYIRLWANRGSDDHEAKLLIRLSVPSSIAVYHASPIREDRLLLQWSPALLFLALTTFVTCSFGGSRSPSLQPLDILQTSHGAREGRAQSYHTKMKVYT